MEKDSFFIQFIGWIYFIAWSLSFYGQLYENHKNKNVEGYSLKYQVLNLTGFSFYAIYSSFGYFDHDPGAGNVDLNDLCFAYHAIFIVILTSIQCIIYPRGKNKVGKEILLLISLLWVVAITMLYKNKICGDQITDKWNACAVMGYMKLFISFIKYLPQVYWNFIRKTTIGWSIFNILLDFTGGFFSTLQVILEGTDNINLVKFILGFIAMGFDIIFIVQHYFLYPQKIKLLNQETNNLL